MTETYLNTAKRKLFNKLHLLFPLLLAILYFVFNKIFIIKNHFNEDAYILFRYADMFNKGYGITYFPHGEPIEGATDFLWLIFIIIFSKIGIDIGTSAMILNSIGVFIICYIFTLLAKESENKLIKIVLFIVSILWILFYPVIAALGGFSVMLYCALFIIPLYLVDKNKYLEFIPLFAIILGLFRPDGVLLGMGLSILSLYFILKEKKWLLNKFLLNSFIALTIGVIYFVWRYNYFGNLLPLPLYVKQAAGFSNSFWNNFRLSFTYKHIYIYLFIFLAVGFLNFKILKKKFILLIPSILLFLFLSSSHQSQNIGFRFQSTIIIALIYVSCSILSEINQKHLKHKFWIYLLLPFFYLLAGTKVINEIRYSYLKINKDLSIPDFVFEISNKLLKGDELIALTEAGYFSFFQQKDNQLIDLVGLNTPYTAINQLNQTYYDSISPDLIYYMRENTFSPSLFNGKLYAKLDQLEVFNSSYNIPIIQEQAKYSKVPLATLESIKYLNRNWGDYDVYFIRYRKNDPNRISEYTLAVKKDLDISEGLETLLDELQNKNSNKTYYDLIK